MSFTDRMIYRSGFHIRGAILRDFAASKDGESNAKDNGKLNGIWGVHSALCGLGFPKITGGTILGSPKYSILGVYIGSIILGNYHMLLMLL